MTNTKRAHRKVIRYLIILKGEEQNSLLHQIYEIDKKLCIEGNNGWYKKA